jgi:hypothetical protein
MFLQHHYLGFIIELSFLYQTTLFALKWNSLLERESLENLKMVNIKDKVRRETFIDGLLFGFIFSSTLLTIEGKNLNNQEIIDK